MSVENQLAFPLRVYCCRRLALSLLVRIFDGLSVVPSLLPSTMGFSVMGSTDTVFGLFGCVNYCYRHRRAFLLWILLISIIADGFSVLGIAANVANVLFWCGNYVTAGTIRGLFGCANYCFRWATISLWAILLSPNNLVCCGSYTATTKGPFSYMDITVVGGGQLAAVKALKGNGKPTKSADVILKIPKPTSDKTPTTSAREARHDHPEKRKKKKKRKQGREKKSSFSLKPC